MNKKILKYVFVICLTIIFMSKISAYNTEEYINSETNYKAIIEDDANLLNDQEEQKLLEEIIPLTEYGNIALKTTNQNNSSTAFYSRDYYHDTFGYESGTLLLIDMNNRYIYIFSDGKNYDIVTRSKSYIITDNVYKYASNAEYYKCASEAFKQIGTLLSGGKISEPMRYISNIMLSFIISFFACFLIVLSRTKIKKAKKAEILSKCHVKFDIDNVKVVKTGQHKVYSPVSSSSSYSGSSRSSGGSSRSSSSRSRSSGGGGGHRF